MKLIKEILKIHYAYVYNKFLVIWYISIFSFNKENKKRLTVYFEIIIYMLHI